MQFKLILLSSILLFSSLVLAGEKADCELAIEEADKLVPDPKSDCDHTKTGLNGVLHRALSNKEKETEKDKTVETKDAREKKEISVETAQLILTSEFNSAEELQSVKFNMLAKASLECSKGFTLDAERYIPVASRKMKLELVYRCL